MTHKNLFFEVNDEPSDEYTHEPDELTFYLNREIRKCRKEKRVLNGPTLTPIGETVPTKVKCKHCGSEWDDVAYLVFGGRVCVPQVASHMLLKHRTRLLRADVAHLKSVILEECA